MVNWLTFLIAGLATYRIARMLTEEDGPFSVFLRFRNRYTDDRDWFAIGIRCPYCVGFWVAAFVVLFLVVLGLSRIEHVPLLWPAVAGAAVKIHEWWKR